MTTRDAVRKRAVREFADRPLDPAHLDQVLEAGRRAHSAKNRQRWAFIVVRDRERLRALAGTGPWAGHVAGAGAAVALVTWTRGRGAPLSVTWTQGAAAQMMLVLSWASAAAPPPSTSTTVPARSSATPAGCTASSSSRWGTRPIRMR
jgi:nitroreductase